MTEKIDRYEILQKLAAGGMAELFLAKQSGMEGFEKVVVIKRILSHLASDQEFVNMFLDEARIAAKLSHPNVVQIYDLGRADDTYYIAMEYVSGRNLGHIIKKARDTEKGLPIEHLARIVSGVCDGLFYAHTRKDYDGKPLNIVHRDISPQNVLVSFAGGVKLVDFGIAKASTQLAQTRAGVLKGKYSYMSPEQVRGDKIDGRSDIFAVGIVMYEMLTGQRPFERENSLKTLKAIVQEKPLNPRELNPDVPAEVIKVLSKSLEKDPNRRYANAQEMQLALEDWLERSPAKSNNVRISRYMYDLFDDELSAEGGTIEVKGVGEVIIPTGAAEPLEDRDESIPHNTVRAVLDGQVEEATGKRPPAKVDGEGAAGRGVPKTAARGSPLRTPDPAPPPPVDTAELDAAEMETGEELEGGATDEMDGATVPVYDLEAYERERERRHQEEQRSRGGGASLVPTGPRVVARVPLAPPPPPSEDDFGDMPTRNLVGPPADLLPSKPAPSKPAATRPPAERTPSKGGNHQQASRGSEALAAIMEGDNSTSEEAIKIPSRPPGRTAPPRPPPAPPPPPREPSGPRASQDEDEVIPGLAPAGGRVRPSAARGAGPPRPPPAEAEAGRPAFVAGNTEDEEVSPEVARPARPLPRTTPQGKPRARPQSETSDPRVPALPADDDEDPGSAEDLQAALAALDRPPPKQFLTREQRIVAMFALTAVLLSGAVLFLLVDGPAAAPGGVVTQPGGGQEEVTGSVVIKTTPPGADIYLDGRKQESKSPTMIARLPVDKPVVVLCMKDGLEKRESVTLTKETPRKTLDLKLEKKK